MKYQINITLYMYVTPTSQSLYIFYNTHNTEDFYAYLYYPGLLSV